MADEPKENDARFDYGDERDEGATPIAAATPSAKNVPMVDEDTKLRIRPGEKTPDPGEDNAVRVPESEWQQHNRRKDTATARANDEPID